MQYKNFQTDAQGRIIDILDDEKGNIREAEDTKTSVYGIFAQETLKPTDKLTIDVSFRLDRVNVDTDLDIFSVFNFSPFGPTARRYVPADPANPGAPVNLKFDRDFNLFAPRLGITYRITDYVNIYGLIAQAEQVPFSNELEDNRNLDEATVRTAEMGFKGRGPNWSFDTALYYTETEDEVIGTLVNGETRFENAGETEKMGFEIDGKYTIVNDDLGDLTLGAAYSYTDYKFDEFASVANGVLQDFSGNTVQYIPDNLYSLYAQYNRGGFTFRIRVFSRISG